jgi:serine protease Do
MSTRFRNLVSVASIAGVVSAAAVAGVMQLRGPDAVEASSGPHLAATLAAGPADAPFGLHTFRDIARAVSPGVVNINTEKIVERRAMPDPFRDFFGQSPFGPRGGRGEKQKLTSLGSGFVIDADGHILTNRHVVDGADEIRVTFPNRKTYDAELIGKDARTDVALIKIEAKEPLTVVQLGDSDTAEAGEWVVAIGSPFNMRGTVTVGVVSYTGRPVGLEASRTSATEMIQTDAAINPGNSGGPLLNTRGEAIGINTLIMTQGVGQSAGVGFAVPINTARRILPQLKEKGSVTRGWIGVAIGQVDELMARSYGLKEARGAAVSEVTPDGPADKAGIQVEDVILEADGVEIEDNGDLVEHISTRTPGTVVTLRVFREGATHTIKVTLGTFPEADADGDREPEKTARLGMSYRELTAGLADQLRMPGGTRGIVVTSIEPGEAADDAGLARGDVIVSVNSREVETIKDFEEAIERAKSDGLARLRVRRRDTAFLAVIQLE